MTTLDQLRTGLSRAWHTISEGWHELVDRAGDAITRFHPRQDADVDTREQRIARAGTRWGVLAAEVRVDENEVEVSIEVPGMERSDFDIHVVEDVLVVRGERRVEHERKHGEYHVMQRAYGAFERALRLPVPVDESGANAAYERGVLRITLPRTSARKARRIEVSTG